MKIKIILGLMVMTITASLVVGATTAMFSDVETSNGNIFTAGTLDLLIDDGNINVAKFNVENMTPDSPLNGSYKLTNAGTIDGYLDFSKITVINLENGIGEPEAAAGDDTPDVGELGKALNVRLYFDNDSDGRFGTDDVMIYNGKANDMPATLQTDKLLKAGESVIVGGDTVINWTDTGDNASDNQAQGDTLQLDFEFLLSQKSSQID